MSDRWYVIRCITGWEVKAAKVLRRRGYVIQLPAYRKPASRHVKRKRRKLHPLFDGYLFCTELPRREMDWQDELCIQNRKGERVLLSVVGNGDTPTPADQAEIALAMQMAKEIDRERKSFSPAKFRPGERVIVSVGRGEIEGEVVRCAGPDVIVLVNLMGRSFFVTREAGAVRTVRARIEALEHAA